MNTAPISTNEFLNNVANLPMPDRSKIFFTHPRVSFMTGRKRVESRATIAWQIYENGTTKAGIALCSPLDNFCRAVGRYTAVQMLDENPIELNISGSILTEEICGLLSTCRQNHFLRMHKCLFTPYYQDR